jgi:hypothetical protein
VAEDYEGRTAAFRADHVRFREELQGKGHKRTTDAGAQLLATWRTLLAFALEVGAVTEAEHADLWKRVEDRLKAALEPQAAHQAQNDPVVRFRELLAGLFTSYRAHVVDATTGEFPGDGWGWEAHKDSFGRYAHAKGTRIGWLDGDDLYLEPAATYAELQRFARDQGESMPVTERTLWKRLRERGVVAATEEGHSTVKRTFANSGRVRVLHISATSLLSGASGADGAEDAQDGEKTYPKLGREESGTGRAGQPKGGGEQRPERRPFKRPYCTGHAAPSSSAARAACKRGG